MHTPPRPPDATGDPGSAGSAEACRAERAVGPAARGPLVLLALLALGAGIGYYALVRGASPAFALDPTAGTFPSLAHGFATAALLLAATAGRPLRRVAPLAVGAEDGVYVLDNSDVGNPRRIADFRHARAEDPVVARNGYAYVTLRDTGAGVEGANTMTVVDVRDPANPTLVTRLAMQGPRGLSIGADGTRVYVCDGRAGLKTFDITDPADPVFASAEPDLDCLDVIALDGRLHAITADELVQYDASTDDLVELSRLGTGAMDEAAFARGPIELR